MRIVHTESSCGWGGQELRVLTEAQGMIARRHQVEIWAPAQSNIYKEAQRRGVPCRTLPIERRTLTGLKSLRRAIADTRPDVVNTHSSTDSWLVAIACLTLSGAPPVVRTRHISAPVPTDFATRWLYNHATRHIVTTGERLRETLIAINGLRADRITSIPTGVDTNHFHPGDAREARRVLGLDVEKRYIGIVATLRSWKGHLYLIDAFANLARHDDGLRLIIVGDGPMLDALKERTAALRITDEVVFAGRQENVPEWLRAFDIFCLPSYANEGVPQALVQAMLTALPVVTTAVGSISEAASDGSTALIVPPKDADSLANALQSLLSDPTLAERLGRAARSRALQQFDAASMVARMEAIFRETIENHAAIAKNAL
ncbi:MAG: glycosyltransferase family 4 protein [Sulfurifustaceae bacterium]